MTGLESSSFEYCLTTVLYSMFIDPFLTSTCCLLVLFIVHANGSHIFILIRGIILLLLLPMLLPSSIIASVFYLNNYCPVFFPSRMFSLIISSVFFGFIWSIWLSTFSLSSMCNNVSWYFPSLIYGFCTSGETLIGTPPTPYSKSRNSHHVVEFLCKNAFI